ncbi:hypothetical protein N9241_01640 [bacterium]|nr:hypothetical protein [bacterium]
MNEAISESDEKSDKSGCEWDVFEKSELLAMHQYCCKYRDLIRTDDMPTQSQTDNFMRYQRVCYDSGVAYE